MTVTVWVLVLMMYTPQGAFQQPVAEFDNPRDCYAQLNQQQQIGRQGYCTPVKIIR